MTHLVQVLVLCQIPQQHLVVLVGRLPIGKGLVSNLLGLICVLLRFLCMTILCDISPLLPA